MAASTGFEPAIFCVTSRRGRPDSPNSPVRVYTILQGPHRLGGTKASGGDDPTEGLIGDSNQFPH
jgi:hypothetical protein